MADKINIENFDTNSSCLTEKENLLEEQKVRKLFNYLTNKNQKKKSTIVSDAKNFPTYFFICFLLIFCVLIFKFIPNMYQMADKSSRYENVLKKKYSIKYFSQFLGDLDIYSKVKV